MENIYFKEEDIKLEKDYIELFNKFIKDYKNQNHVKLKDIYSDLEINCQIIYRWKLKIMSTQSKNYTKQKFIKNVGDLFNLNSSQLEEIANRAGFSFINKLSGEEFSYYFNSILDKYKNDKFKKNKDLYEEALISKEMFYHIKAGRHLRKESLLALFIVMELDLENIQLALSKSGYILSKSLINDFIIILMLKSEKLHKLRGFKRLEVINEELFNRDLPTLGTREKAEISMNNIGKKSLGIPRGS
ncbi:MAG: hypothetical protein FWF57_00825 [Defluviitaleaceae bacterium]|nr:hypothetical protein [Defluviitaleaceae bacterium]